MFKKISTSYSLVKISFSYIKRDGELLVYSIMSLLASLAILLTFVWIDFYTVGFIDSLSQESESGEVVSEMIVYWAMFAYYFIFSFITFFFNTAIITSVQRRNEWKDNKLWDGLRDSMKHLKEIFIWSLINATVTMILKIIQSKFPEDSFVWKIIVWIIWWMWNILTFFSFPIMIINKVGPKDAIKESASLFKKTWGERAAIHVWIGFMFFFMYLIVIFIAIFVITTGLIITGFSILILGLMFLAILSSTADVIIKTILLHYAQYGTLPDWLNDSEKNIFGDIAWEKK